MILKQQQQYSLKGACRYKERISGYQWEEGRREGQYRDGGLKKGLFLYYITGLYENMCLKLLKTVKHSGS